MKKTLLEELYRGNLRLDEGIIPDDPEYQDLTRQIIDIMDAWKEELPADRYDQLETLMELQCRTIAMEAAMAFRCGFKLGAAIMLEVVSGKEGFIHGGGD